MKYIHIYYDQSFLLSIYLFTYFYFKQPKNEVRIHKHGILKLSIKSKRKILHFFFLLLHTSLPVN